MSAETQTPATLARELTDTSPGWQDLRTAWRQVGWELRHYVRRPEVVFFTFAFPLLMLAIFSAAFGGMGEIGPKGSGVTMTGYYLPSMLAAGAILSGIQNLTVDIATERFSGGLQRLAATPLRPWQYFVGKFGQVLVTAAVQAALTIAMASLAFGVKLPHDAGHWWTAVWVYFLGLIGGALLGIALSALPRSQQAATAIVVPTLLVLQFISGVYLQFNLLPHWLQLVSGAFPLRWLAAGLRAAFLPDGMASVEPGGTWNLGTVAIMLLVWLVVGGILAKLTFRWVRRS